MEWINRINDAIDFIETHIDEKVDYTKAASAACCSLSRFQNMFMFITDITPSEYVRRRRMALSAQELLESKIKIVDLSFKYGYESPEAFTRSFKAFHGISPSDVRLFGKHNTYPRISFSLQIKGGHFTMGVNAQFEVYKDILVKMETIELTETLKFAGLTNPGPVHFECIGKYHELYKPLILDRHTPYTEIGIASNVFQHEGWYAFGCQVDSTDGLPESMVALDTGLTKFAVCTFRMQPGNDTVDLVGGEDGSGPGMDMASEYLATVWMPKHKDLVYGYGYNEGDHTFHIEVKKNEKPYRIINISDEGLEESYKIFGWPEIYHANIDEELEMRYYIPLK